jgi:hypothetical protein
MKYVRNTYTSDIQINLKQDGHFLKSVTFTRYATDRSTGQVVSDGFTEVEDEDYALLKDSAAYALMLKQGKLVEQEKAPLRAGSFEQMLALQEKARGLENIINQIKAENDSLKAENDRLIEQNGLLTQACDQLKAENDRLKGVVPEDGGDASIDLSSLTVAQLKVKAAGYGITVDDKAKKADIIAAIEAKVAEMAGE